MGSLTGWTTDADGNLIGTGPGRLMVFDDQGGHPSRPSITFTNDPDTGFFNNGPDDLGVAVGGIQGLDLYPRDGVINRADGQGVQLDVSGRVTASEVWSAFLEVSQCEPGIPSSGHARIACQDDGSGEITLTVTCPNGAVRTLLMAP